MDVEPFSDKFSKWLRDGAANDIPKIPERLDCSPREYHDSKRIRRHLSVFRFYPIQTCIPLRGKIASASSSDALKILYSSRNSNDSEKKRSADEA